MRSFLKKTPTDDTNFHYQQISRSVQFSHSVLSNSLRLHRLQPTRLLCPWSSPGKNTGVGSHAFLQGIFLTQGSNSGLLRCRQILLQSEPPGKPILIIREVYIFYYFISDGGQASCIVLYMGHVINILRLCNLCGLCCNHSTDNTSQKQPHMIKNYIYA